MARLVFSVRLRDTIITLFSSDFCGGLGGSLGATVRTVAFFG
jgi:hypothetical protein